MQLFAFTQVLLLFTFLQGTLCLPAPAPQPFDLQGETSSPNSALEARATLEKRDSWDCKGSGMCSTVPQETCLTALNAFKTNDIFWKEKRRWVKYDAFVNGHCLAMWTCSNPQDYVSAGNSGVSRGYSLVDKALSIYSKNGGNCKKCGSVWFWGSCRFTLNYCSGNCDG
ncbi:hypothetical protein TWF970_003062 [Orbilia oligospora]|uniref:Killer toxin Kp4 domain-containing protein n=1 Tax=Orbilia oligospora TaxID=2813651 RepID=A0A7C8RGF9_ORBOL|nr:hypothetical protein TWF970_003062 [Orbilia oligospora]